MSDRLHLRFLGVRGSYPTPLAAHLGFGGQTTCLEVRAGSSDRLFIDAGTGIIGVKGAEQTGRVNILFTHFHIDHIMGLPFFGPMFERDCHLSFWSGQPSAVARSNLDVLLSSPYSPAWDSVAATREYVQVETQSFSVGSLTIHPFPLNHPQGCVGYRIESAGAVVVHASDLEHGHPQLDSTLREYAQDADVLVYDAQFTDEEYRSKKGWGHSTWREATRVARDAGVKRLILFHHDPEHDDAAMRTIEGEARRQFENTEAAREGVTLTL